MESSSQIKKLIKNNKFLLQIGYFLLIFNQVLAQSQFNEQKFTSIILKLFRWGLIFLFVVLIIKEKKYPRGKRGMLWIFFGSISFLEMIFFNGKLLLIILFLVIAVLYKSDPKEIMIIHVCALVLGLIIVSSSSFIGILDTLAVSKQLDNVTGFLFKTSNIRYSFGFSSSNVIPIISLYTYLYILIIKQNNYKWYYDIFFLVFNFIVYCFCGSRVCIVLFLFAITLRWFIKINKKIFLHYSILCSLILLTMCLAFSLILPGTALYSTSLVSLMDKMLTARITISRNVLMKYPITLFGYGEIINDNSKEYLVMDNGYIALFVVRGVMIGLIMIAMLVIFIRRSQHNRDPYCLLFIIIMLLTNIVDNTILHYITFPIYVCAFNKYFDKSFHKRRHSYV